jgi:AraC-like DNA-binding protein
VGVIAVLVPHPIRVQRIRAAVRDQHAVVACESWSELTRVCETEAVYLAVFDLYADGGTASLDRVRLLQRRFPKLALVAYVGANLDAYPDRWHDLFDAGRVGVDVLVVADRDDSDASLATLFEQAEARTVVSAVRQALEHAKPAARDALLTAVTRAHERLTAERLARVLAVPRRVLSARLLDAGFPPPQQLVTWGRLFVAAHMLEDRQRSVESVAYALHFASGSAFRNTCQRYLRGRPQDIRARGGGEYAVRVFLDRLARGDAVEELSEAAD